MMSLGVVIDRDNTGVVQDGGGGGVVLPSVVVSLSDMRASYMASGVCGVVCLIVCCMYN